MVMQDDWESNDWEDRQDKDWEEDPYEEDSWYEDGWYNWEVEESYQSKSDGSLEWSWTATRPAYESIRRRFGPSGQSAI